MSETHRWLGAISTLVGAWVFASAFVFDMATPHFWNNVLAGAGIVGFAGYVALRAAKTTRGVRIAASVATLLGLWMIATPFVFGVGTTSMLAFESTTTAMWSGVISGFVVAVLSGYTANEARKSGGVRRPGTTSS